MKLECPYCKNELVKGFFYSGRYGLKWYDENAGILESITAFGGEVLSCKQRIKCYRCKNCNKIIIDLNKL